MVYPLKSQVNEASGGFTDHCGVMVEVLTHDFAHVVFIHAIGFDYVVVSGNGLRI
jgi:hypothetical protein